MSGEREPVPEADEAPQLSMTPWKRNAGIVSVALLAFSLYGASLALRALRTGRPERSDWILLLVALVVAVVAGRLAPEISPESSAPAGGSSWRPDRSAAAWTALAALGLAVALELAGVAFHLQVVAWVAAVAALLLVYRKRGDGGARLERADLILLGGVTLVSLAARLVLLGAIPGGLYGDEAVYGQFAIRVLGADPPPPFSDGPAFTPALWSWLQAPGIWLAGRGMAGLRLVPALGASFAVVPVFLLLRRGAGRTAAVGGALLLATLPLHVHASRIAISEAWVGALVPAAMAALFLLLHRPEPRRAVELAVAVGLCFYLGSKFALLPPVLVGSALAVLVAGGTRRWIAPLSLAVGVTALLVAPQLIHYSTTEFFGPLVSHPLRWMRGAAGFDPAGRAAAVARLFLDSRELSPFSAVPGWRFLPLLQAALMVAGLGLTLARPRRPLHAFLLGWSVAGLGSLVLDPEPSQLFHLVAVAPLPALFGSLAIALPARALVATSAGRRIGVALATLLALAAAGDGVRSYFFRSGGIWLHATTTAIGRAMHDLAPDHHLALVTPPMSWDLNSTLLYMAPGVRAEDKWAELPAEEHWVVPDGRDVAFIVDVRRIRLLDAIRRRYPGGRLDERRDRRGELLASVYLVTAEEIESVDGSRSREQSEGASEEPARRPAGEGPG